MITSMPNSTAPFFVKNPNYNPLDQRSNRYVTDAAAQQEAQKKAQGLNDFFAPFTGIGDKLKTYDAGAFYTPLAQPQIVPNIPQAGALTTTGGALPALVPGRGVGSAPQVPTQPVTTGAVRAPVMQSGTTVPTTAPQAGQGGIDVAGAIRNTVVQKGGALTPTEIATLAKQAGEAGMSSGDFLGLLEANAKPTTAQVSEIRTKLGIPNLVDEAFRQPDKSLSQTYQELYGMSDLGSIKNKVAALDDTIAQKRADLVRATGEINNNPWVSQATRQGRLKNLQDIAYADINNDIDSKNSYLSLYDQGVSDIENRLNLAQSDRAEARQLTVDHLNYLLNEAERETSGLQQDTITGGLRNVPAFLEGVLGREATQQARDIAKVVASKTGSVGGVGTGNGKGVSALAKQVLEAPELLSNFTPTERGKVITELVNAGYDVSSIAAPQINAAGREQIAQYDDLVRQGKQAETLLSEVGVNTGMIASRIRKTGAALGFAEDFTRYRSVIDNMGSALLKLRSGAAVTPQEFERLRGFIPAVNDDESTAQTKITEFYKELETAKQNYILRQTQTTQQIRQGAGLTGGSTLDSYLSSQGF